MTGISEQATVAATGIEGLDRILNGGFPKNHVYLVQGDPGVGKTTLSLQFLLEGAKAGERGLYITMSESERDLRAVARSHGWDLEPILIFEHLVGEEELSEVDSTIFQASEIELGPAVKKMLQKIDEVKPERVVLDSLAEIRLLAQSSLRYRKQVLALKQFFDGRNITALLLDDRTSEVKDMQLQSVPHGVVELERYTPNYGMARRRLQIVKVRGLKFRAGYHDFNIVTGGIIVYPRLVAAESRLRVMQSFVSSGISELDKLLGGGLDRGTSTLMMGPAGSGKSALATQYAVAAAHRGEPAAFFTFDESLTTLFNRSDAMGYDLTGLVSSGKVSVQQVDPAELQPGEFAQLVREAVDHQKVRVLIIDSLNGYLNAMPEEKYLLLHLHELLSFLGQHGIATILVFAQHGLLGSHMGTTVDISYLADCVILLRYYESQGSVCKAISVIKKRSGAHETSIRHFEITKEGIKVGRPLKHFRGVLSGTPVIEEVAPTETEKS
ncbi:MAG TPA: ATPase domain-containing protein [Thermoanaerobaculia bacterium]|jgi:circadian clock protein KaiC